MGQRPPSRLTLRTLLRLGRVSNLPTVWTNALAGAVLAGGGSLDAVLLACLALSLFYVGGMWLNDAFDAEVDARERKARPIPAGEIGVGTVFAVGCLLLATGVVIAATLGPLAAMAGFALAASIVLYDWLHKHTVFAPLIMGVTRFLCYILGALAAGGLNLAVLIGAVGLFAYVVGLTYAAKQEAYDKLEAGWPLAVLAGPLLVALWLSGGDLWALTLAAGLAIVGGVALRRLFRRERGDVPHAVVTLIAGISLYDAALIAGAASGGTMLAFLAVTAFALTLALQRVVPGT